MSAGAEVRTERGSVLAVLRSRHVPRLLSASLIGRLPTGMAPLAILLTVRGNGGDYRLAGLLAALYAGSAAVSGPVLGRLIDRTRQAPVLLASAVVSTAAFLALGLVDPVRSAVVGALAAVVAGAATPQLEPCLRVLWEHVVAGEHHVRAAFSLDAATQELIFVCGPLAVLGATAFGGPPAGLLAAAAVGLFGTTWFATARPARAWRGTPTAGHWAGPLRGAGVLRLFAALVCVGATIGAFTVGITGHAEVAGSSTAAGWLIALNAAGALVGGLAYTAVPAARREDRRLLVLLALLALGYLPLVSVLSVPVMAVFAFLSGCSLPAVLASAFALIARMAPEGTLTEAHAWMITSFGVGNALGSAAAGTLLDLVAPWAAFVLATAAACTGAALAVRRLLA
ncbi:MFS transporter [Saccharopolyspora hordei]|uniref:MFS family permease n=1 Tax=Saccharopolyspora hordei TaxID=1838 RepID=A0A853ALD0_9PSEU|nr:MFS transporter [Saccharopolyspora hordei]NYI84848.1 MFS family permease [Saccharopolyspora hordei]